MAYRLATASTAACAIGGILVTDGIWRHAWQIAVSGMGVLVVGVVGVIAATVRYALRQFDARTRDQLREVTEQHRLNDLSMQQREHNLERREEALARQRTAAALRVASYARTVDDTRDACTALRQRVAALEAEIAEVNDERNELIANELLASRQRFTAKGYGHLQMAASGGAVIGAHGHTRARDTAPVPDLEPPLRRIDTP